MQVCGPSSAWHLQLPAMLHILVACALAATGTVATGTCTPATTNSARYSFQLGEYNATVIEDGPLLAPIDQAPYVAPKEKLQRLLADAYLSTELVRCFLISSSTSMTPRCIRVVSTLGTWSATPDDNDTKNQKQNILNNIPIYQRERYAMKVPVQAPLHPNHHQSVFENPACLSAAVAQRQRAVPRAR